MTGGSGRCPGPVAAARFLAGAAIALFAGLLALLAVYLLLLVFLPVAMMARSIGDERADGGGA